MRRLSHAKIPAISVILPAHNAGLYIEQAISSILSQSFQNFELILINDGSTDGTGAIMRRFAKQQPKKIQLISYRKNQGESAAANLGFRASRGAFNARMDADDIAHPDRLRKQLNFLKKHPGHIVVGCQAHVIDSAGSLIGQKTFPTRHETIYAEYGNVHPMLHPSVMFRRALLPNPQQLWANQAEPNDDYFTLFDLLQHGKFANLPEKLLFYRMHDHNKSMQHVKAKFLNSLWIRWHAITTLGYRIPIKTLVKLFAQAGFVLGMPEWVTLGVYFYTRGIKPFELAFPQLARAKQRLFSLPHLLTFPRLQFARPTLSVSIILGLFHTLSWPRLKL